jgi:crossover junction endodeoxyribonuclease RusA
MTTLELVVYGRPAPQGSKRHVGGGRMIESSKHVKPWRDDVKAAAEALLAGQRPWAPLNAPLIVRMVFTTSRPRSHYRTGRNAHLLRDNAPARPHGKPDASKLIRSTEDALTDAGLWRDDALVVEYERAAKVYAGEDPEALDRPGARITIRLLAGPTTTATDR